MTTLLAMAGFETVDLRKIDIEGSEQMLFEEQHDLWLARVRNVRIALHGKRGEEAFYRAMSAFGAHELAGQMKSGDPIHKSVFISVDRTAIMRGIGTGQHINIGR